MTRTSAHAPWSAALHVQMAPDHVDIEATERRARSVRFSMRWSTVARVSPSYGEVARWRACDRLMALQADAFVSLPARYRFSEFGQ
jgi:hypothetical protein